MKLAISSMLLACAIALVFVAAPVLASEDESEMEFETALTGAREVPPVTTAASGEAEVKLAVSGDSATLEFEVEVCNIQNVVAAHIHAAVPPGGNAPVRVFLFSLAPGEAPFSTTGCATLSEGTVTLGPTVGGMARADFINALVSGNAYINVHTTAHPGGEIRGWLTTEDEG